LISLHAVQRENEGFRRFVVLFLIRQQNHELRAISKSPLKWTQEPGKYAEYAFQPISMGFIF
jgi:hypothetical protein